MVNNWRAPKHSPKLLGNMCNSIGKHRQTDKTHKMPMITIHFALVTHHTICNKQQWVKILTEPDHSSAAQSSDQSVNITEISGNQCQTYIKHTQTRDDRTRPILVLLTSPGEYKWLIGQCWPAGKFPMASVCYNAKVCGDQSNCWQGMVLFRFSKWWPFALLDFQNSKF